MAESKHCYFYQGPGTAQIGEGGNNAWFVIDDDDDELLEKNDELEITDVRERKATPISQTSQQENGKKGGSPFWVSS